MILLFLSLWNKAENEIIQSLTSFYDFQGYRLIWIIQNFILGV